MTTLIRLNAYRLMEKKYKQAVGGRPPQYAPA